MSAINHYILIGAAFVATAAITIAAAIALNMVIYSLMDDNGFVESKAQNPDVFLTDRTSF